MTWVLWQLLDVAVVPDQILIKSVKRLLRFLSLGRVLLFSVAVIPPLFWLARTLLDISWCPTHNVDLDIYIKFQVPLAHPAATLLL